MPLSIDLFMIEVRGLERSWPAGFKILTEQECKPGALLRGRDFISTSISPGKTGLKANDSKNDSLGKYCKSSSGCAIFDANVCPVEANCLLRVSGVSVRSDRGDIIISVK